MSKQTENDISEAAGYLGSIPSRAGMSFLANQLVIKQMVAGGTMVVLDKGSFSAEVMLAENQRQKVEQFKRVMRVGRKRNDGLAVQPNPVPYYRQFDKRKF